MDFWREFHGTNAAFVLERYDRYRRDPNSVDAATRAYFAHWTPPREATAAPPQPVCDQIMGVVALANAIRAFGHLAAHLDPLGSAAPGDPELEAAAHDVTEEDLRRLPASLVGGPVAERTATAFEAIAALRTVYSSATGYGYAHIHAPRERDWLRIAAESGRFRPPRDPIDQAALLARLTDVECFERFLHRTFPGKTRFSIEGVDMLVPILDEVIGEAAEAGTRQILVGMAHRGRLSVLTHVLGMPYAQILAEFKDPAQGRSFTIREDLSWTGDVTYHLGARRALKGERAVQVVISMPPNPSHVEHINPVVEGMARAAGTRVDGPGPPSFDPAASLPILLHGDAAFPAQGVVAETLNLSRLPGYHTGGTIHIIINNQLGYTTEPWEGRSTLYASDLAKGFEIPVVHVNADAPEACIEAARLAVAYRAEFRKDFLIDLVGYRRHGHNEGDEPSFTQPVMYHKIAAHPTVRTRWAETLVARAVVPPEQPSRMIEERMQSLRRVLESLQPETDLAAPAPAAPPPGAARNVQTAVPMDRLRSLHEALQALPPGFTLDAKLARVRDRRRQALDALDELTVDWALAEELALGSLLEDGVAIRLTGEDVARGTFGQRHAVLHDAKTGAAFTPLQALARARVAFAVFNSPLTENAALGFEFGYNVQAPGRLTLWEAQYGDFVNSAQAMLDEFIVSARAKWGQTPSLVLLLPHGFEGQGPDHSSARPERVLQLAAETNLRLVNCTTAAQYFHVLRRQAALLSTDPLPLVILTPKSLLRHPASRSSLRDLSEGRFQPVLADPQAAQHPERVRRVVLCSGKVFVDLTASERRASIDAVAMVRVEQLYLFPAAELAAVLNRYSALDDVVWLQEEPENMGAWSFVQPHLAAAIRGRWPLRFIGRPPNSSPAEGSAAWHAMAQAALIQQAYDLGPRRDAAASAPGGTEAGRQAKHD
jgi:2-oxoglutarate dehydrogenase E1 component